MAVLDIFRIIFSTLIVILSVVAFGIDAALYRLGHKLQHEWIPTYDKHHPLPGDNDYVAVTAPTDFSYTRPIFYLICFLVLVALNAIHAVNLLRSSKAPTESRSRPWLGLLTVSLTVVLAVTSVAYGWSDAGKIITRKELGRGEEEDAPPRVWEAVFDGDRGTTWDPFNWFCAIVPLGMKSTQVVGYIEQVDAFQDACQKATAAISLTIPVLLLSVGLLAMELWYLYSDRQHQAGAGPFVKMIDPEEQNDDIPLVKMPTQARTVDRGDLEAVSTRSLCSRRGSIDGPPVNVR